MTEKVVSISVDTWWIAAVAAAIWFFPHDGVSLGRAVVYHLTDGAIHLQPSEDTE